MIGRDRGNVSALVCWACGDYGWWCRSRYWGLDWVRICDGGVCAVAVVGVEKVREVRMRGELLTFSESA